MKVIIVGCGKVGRQLAGRLADDNNEVTVIDTNEANLYETTNQYDVMGILGNGATNTTQSDAAVENADVFIAVTDSDELNLLCCVIAKKSSKCKTIARVRNPEYNSEIDFIKQEMGISMVINPEKIAANQISKILHCPSAITIDSFSEDSAELVEYSIEKDSILDGLSIKELSKQISEDIVVCAVKKESDIEIPDGSFILQANDLISFITTPKGAASFFKKIGLKSTKVKNTIIAGGSRICYYLAKELINNHIEVKIIEQKETRCVKLKELLPEASIICGDVSDQELLEEVGINNCESFVSLLNYDESNIFLSLYANKLSKSIKVITKVNRMSFSKVIDNLDIGTIIDPKSLTADHIIRYVRAYDNSLGKNIETLYKIGKSNTQALEFKIDNSDLKIKDKIIRDLKLKSGLVIPCVIREKSMIIANGSTKLLSGDKIIVVTTNKSVKSVNDILK